MAFLCTLFLYLCKQWGEAFGFLVFLFFVIPRTNQSLEDMLIWVNPRFLCFCVVLR